ncbi:hypothetical protein P167DRAFT_547020 [Morchella conica CCBAS932]|uniref:Uncharacterized protein n=1 Tax=Morchella conica CCBAS932 TaxID=1392247 RepID=A0A3N4KMU7_9PEZI|nr:hypothetical protein P167DRAFT_547020 [Morchella conica CCBAS932]
MKRHPPSPLDPPRRSTRIKRPPPPVLISVAVPAPARPPPIPRVIITNDPTALTSTTPNTLDSNAPLSNTVPATQIYYLPATEKSDLYTFFRADYARTGYRPTNQQLRAWFAYTHGGRQLPLEVIAAVIGGGEVVGRSANTKVGYNMAARIRDWALARKGATGAVPGVAECMVWMQRVGMEMRGDVNVGEVLGGMVDEEEGEERGGEGWEVLDGLNLNGVVDGGKVRRERTRRRWEEIVAREEVYEEVERGSCLTLPAAKCARHEAKMKALGLENTTGVTGGWTVSEKGESWDESEETTESSEANTEANGGEESCAESEQIRSSRRNTRFSAKQTTAQSENSLASTPPGTPSSSTRTRSNTPSSPARKPISVKAELNRKHTPTPPPGSTTSGPRTPNPLRRPTTRSQSEGKQHATTTGWTAKSKRLEPTGRYNMRSRRSTTFETKSDDESGDEDSEGDADNEEESESESEEEEKEEKKENKVKVQGEHGESEDWMEDTIVCVFRGAGSSVAATGGGDGGGGRDRGRRVVKDDTSSYSDDASEDKDATSEDEDEEMVDHKPISTPEKKQDVDHDITMGEDPNPLAEPTLSDEDHDIPTHGVLVTSVERIHEIVDAASNQLLQELLRVSRVGGSSNTSEATTAISSPLSQPVGRGEVPVVVTPESVGTVEGYGGSAVESSTLSEFSTITESPTPTSLRTTLTPILTTTSNLSPTRRSSKGNGTQSNTPQPLEAQSLVVEKECSSTVLDGEGDIPILDSQVEYSTPGRWGPDERVVPHSEGDTLDVEMGMDLDTDLDDEVLLAHGSPSIAADAMPDTTLPRGLTPAIPPHSIVQNVSHRLRSPSVSISVVDRQNEPVYQILRQQQSLQEEAQEMERQREVQERQWQTEMQRMSEEPRRIPVENRAIDERVGLVEGEIMTGSQATLMIAHYGADHTPGGHFRDAEEVQHARSRGLRSVSQSHATLNSSGDIPQTEVNAQTPAALQEENTQVVRNTIRGVLDQIRLQPTINAEDHASQDAAVSRDYDRDDDWSSLGDTTVSEGGWSLPDNPHAARNTALEQIRPAQANDDDAGEEREIDWDMQGDTTVSEGGWSVPDAVPEMEGVGEEGTAVAGGFMAEDERQGPALFTYGPPLAIEDDENHDTILRHASQPLVHNQDDKIPITPCEDTRADNGNGGNSVISDILELFGTATVTGMPMLVGMENYLPSGEVTSEEEDAPEGVYVSVAEEKASPPAEAPMRDGSVSAEIKHGTTPAEELPGGGRGHIILSGGQGIMFRQVDDISGHSRHPMGALGSGYKQMDEERKDFATEPPILIKVTATEHRHTSTEHGVNQDNNETTIPRRRRAMEAYVEDLSDDESGSLVVDLNDYLPSQVAEVRSPVLSGIDHNPRKGKLDEVDDARPVRAAAVERRPQGLESSIHADVSRYLDGFDPTVEVELERVVVDRTGGDSSPEDESEVQTSESDDDEEDDEEDEDEEDEEGEILERGGKRKRAALSSSSSENSGPARKTKPAFASELNSNSATLPYIAWGKPTTKKINVAPQEKQPDTVFLPKPNTETATFPDFTWNRPSNSQPSPFQSRLINTLTLRQHARSLQPSPLTPARTRTPTTASVTHAATFLAFSPLHTDFRDTPAQAGTHAVVGEWERWRQTRAPEEVVASVGYRTSDGRYENESGSRIRGTPAYVRELAAGTVLLERRLKGWYDSVVGAGARGVTQRALEVKVEELAEGSALSEGWLEGWKMMQGVVIVVAGRGCVKEDPICLDDDDDE